MNKATDKHVDDGDVSAQLMLGLARIWNLEPNETGEYHRIRNGLNSLPGVDIVSLPRDAEFGVAGNRKPSDH